MTCRAAANPISGRPAHQRPPASTLSFHQALRRRCRGGSRVAPITGPLTRSSSPTKRDPRSGWTPGCVRRPVDADVLGRTDRRCVSAAAHDGPRRLDLSDRSAGAGEVAGVTADKIRFFPAAYTVGSPADLVPLMTDRSYAGKCCSCFHAEGDDHRTTRSARPTLGLAATALGGRFASASLRGHAIRRQHVDDQSGRIRTWPRRGCTTRMRGTRTGRRESTERRCPSTAPIWRTRRFQSSAART